MVAGSSFFMNSFGEALMVNTTQPTANLAPAAAVKKIQDERLREVSLLTKIMRRPELGALAGLALVTIFFLSTADASMFTLAGIMNILSPASQLGILAIAAALLMIGGEFDLSIGSMVAFTAQVACANSDHFSETRVQSAAAGRRLKKYPKSVMFRVSTRTSQVAP